MTENDPVGSYIPPRYTAQQTFDYIESELKDCVGDMLPASTCPYGQASQGAAYTLLAVLRSASSMASISLCLNW